VPLQFYRLRADDDFPLDEEPPEDRDGDEDLDELPPEDREGAEARGALREEEEDLEGELARGARLDDPDGLEAVVRLLPLEREGAEARGEGALRLPLEVRGTTGDRLDLELLDEPVLGMTTGVLFDGTVRGCTVDRPVVPVLRDPTPGADGFTGVRPEVVTGVRLDPPDKERLDRDAGALVDDVTGVLPVVGARERPDEDEGALVDGEDLVPEGAATLPPAEPRPDPDPITVPPPPGYRFDLKRLPPEERAPP